MAATERADGQQTNVTPKLSEALLAAQAEMPSLTKDATNPHFRNKYVSLDALLATVLPVLNRHGIVASQHPTYVESITGQLAPALRTVLMHGKSGESVEDTMLLVLAKEDPQGQGAALTYARRYALSAALGLNSDEDDDGNNASRAREPVASRAVASEQHERQGFQPPTGRKITENRRKKLDALIDQLVAAGSMEPKHIEAWCEKRQTSYADLTTGLADELEKSLLKLAKTNGLVPA